VAGFFLLRDQTEHGPFTFRELVQMVRHNELNVDDLVKADWEFDWHPAAEVVGLFHMAGRDDVLALWENEQRKKAEERNSERDFAADSESESESTRSLHATGTPAPEDGWSMPQKSLAETLDEPSLGGTPVAAENSKSSRTKQLIRSMFSQEGLRSGLSWGMAFVCANLTGYGVLNWAEREFSRFPGEINAATTRIFPVWGLCSHTEFAFLLLDAVIIAGILGYGLSRLLLAMAED